MTSSRPRRPVPVLLLGLILVLGLGACGGGGADTASEESDDSIDEVVTTGERSVQVTGAGKVRLGGTLLVPQAATVSPNAKVPGVLFVPAVGSGERNGPIITGATGLDPLAADLAKAFGEAGLASYRYDGRGTGESKLEPGTPLSMDDLVADARAGIDLLSQRKETAGADLAVVAYDTGGLVALRLAAADPRVKRIVLISTPGQPLVEVQAGLLSQQFGPESEAAFRAAVGQLLSTKTLPPVNELRTELRPLLPSDQIPFLAELYAINPVTDAVKVRARALVVTPTDPAVVDALSPTRLGQALAGSEVVPVERVSLTLQVTGPAPSEDPSDPNSPRHDHSASPPQAKVERDASTIGRIAGWLAAKPGP
ncbi:MAG: lysophospholipase [Actinomycetota bacterium]|nr:lysophospholipase [Actinomycetota bacterium]